MLGLGLGVIWLRGYGLGIRDYGLGLGLTTANSVIHRFFCITSGNVPSARGY